MPALLRPEVRLVPSLVEAMREGYSRDNLRPETEESIAAVAAEPEAFVRQLLDPPTTVVLPDGTLGKRVPETLFWYAEGDAFLGSVSVRHELNEILAKWGGHVGYAVRPSARGRGHAQAMLAGALAWAAENLPLERVMLTVSEMNPASVRVIEKAGGVLQDRVAHIWHDGEMGRRYWIALNRP